MVEQISVIILDVAASALDIQTKAEDMFEIQVAARFYISLLAAHSLSIMIH